MSKIGEKNMSTSWLSLAVEQLKMLRRSILRIGLQFYGEERQSKAFRKFSRLDRSLGNHVFVITNLILHRSQVMFCGIMELYFDIKSVDLVISGSRYQECDYACIIINLLPSLSLSIMSLDNWYNFRYMIRVQTYVNDCITDQGKIAPTPSGNTQSSNVGNARCPQNFSHHYINESVY